LVAAEGLKLSTFWL